MVTYLNPYNWEIQNRINKERYMQQITQIGQFSNGAPLLGINSITTKNNKKDKLKLLLK